MIENEKININYIDSNSDYKRYSELYKILLKKRKKNSYLKTLLNISAT